MPYHTDPLLALLLARQRAPRNLPWPPPPTMMTPPWFQSPPKSGAVHGVPVAPSYPMGFPYFTAPPRPRRRRP